MLATLRSFLLTVLILTAGCCIAQNTDSSGHKLQADLEIRPRAEYRDNYIFSANDPLTPDFFISQRNRLAVTYTGSRIKLHISMQEIHIWAKSGVASAVGGLNAYELYAQPSINKKLSVRIGRQGISLDNGRIFSDAPWSQQSRSHEGVRLMYKSNEVANDFMAMFTRPYSKKYDDRNSPVASHQYKALFIHYLKYKPGKIFTYTVINAGEIFENKQTNNSYERLTTGGRVEAEHGNFYATLSGYYQFGHNAQQKPIRAYYLQPEIRLTAGKTIFRAGVEILSGSRGPVSNPFIASFEILYGVAWKFMGNMNLFTRFPSDVGGKGLVNPYLFAYKALNKKITARADFHFFYTQYPQLDAGSKPLKRYLGFENDLSLKYKPVKDIEINYGFSYFLSQKENGLLQKVQNTEKVALWSYLMVSYNIHLLGK